MAKSIAWLAVNFGPSSGGTRTILQNINYLIDDGYKCDLYVDRTDETPDELKTRIEHDYFHFKGGVFTGHHLEKKYDMAVATYYETAKTVADLNVKHKVYFVQDYEPWFFPASEQFINAEKSYALNLKTITIGKWLSRKLDEKSTNNTHPKYYNFCADLSIYHPIESSTSDEDSICCVLQPDKPRRCTEMALRSLQIVKAIRPQTKIYLYGSPICDVENLDATHLGIISVEECNELYNKCTAGLCLSASNPSRIPFEMMAASLPVVELYRENNLYDLPENGCLLAEPSAEALASALLKILTDKKLRSNLSEGGKTYMRDYPLELGYEQVKHIIDSIFQDNDEMSKNKPKIIYGREPIASNIDKIIINKLPKAVLQPIAEEHDERPRSLISRIANKLRRLTR